MSLGQPVPVLVPVPVLTHMSSRVPYTMAKFVVYEKTAEAIYRVFPKKDMSDGMQTTVNLGSGLVAGCAAAVISQPADTMLSKINKTKGLPGESNTSRLIKIGKELGFKGSFAGIGARLFMVGTLTAGQFAIYGTCLQHPVTLLPLRPSQAETS